MIQRIKRCFQWVVAYTLAVPLSLFLAVLIVSGLIGVMLMVFHTIAAKVYEELDS